MSERAREGTGRSRSSVPSAAASTFLGAAGLLIVLYFTLFPFDAVDAGRSASDALERFSLAAGSLWGLRDGPANVVMLVPFGAGVAGLVARRWNRAAVLGAALAGLSLSVVVELAQAIWLLREPSLDDVAANTLGAALGGWLWLWLWSPEGRLAATLAAATGTPRGRMALLGLAMAPMIVAVASVIALRTDARPVGWDPAMSMVLGNVATGDRPWVGSLAQVALADRALDQAEVGHWLDGTRLADIAGPSTLLDLDLGSGIPSGWEVEPSDAAEPPVSTDGRLHLGPLGWITTSGPVSAVSERIESTGAFTIMIDVATGALDQTGPARIVSVSGDVFQANLTVAQDDTALVVRVRSGFSGAGGALPELAVPGVFTDERPHRVAIAYDAAGMRVTVDELQRSATLDLQPETVAMVSLFPDELPRIRTSSVGEVARPTMLALFAFGPWWAAVAVIRRNARSRLVTAAIALVPVVVVGAILALVVPEPTFRMEPLGLVVGTALVVVLGTARRAPA